MHRSFVSCLLLAHLLSLLKLGCVNAADKHDDDYSNDDVPELMF